MNIYQRINEVRKAVSYVKKDATVREGGGYQAVTHDAVTAMLRDALIQHGIVITMSVLNSSVSDTGTTTSKGIPFIRYAATYEVCFVNVETPEDKHTIQVESHAMDVGDKAPGKAMSYAKKYAMLKTFEIETGDDDEGRQEQKADKNAKGIKNGNGTITPTSGAWESLDKETQDWMLSEAMEVTAMIAQNDVEGACKHIDGLGLEADYKVAFWTLLDSKQRSALKKQWELMKAAA